MRLACLKLGMLKSRKFEQKQSGFNLQILSIFARRRFGLRLLSLILVNGAGTITLDHFLGAADCSVL